MTGTSVWPSTWPRVLNRIKRPQIVQILPVIRRSIWNLYYPTFLQNESLVNILPLVRDNIVFQ